MSGPTPRRRHSPAVYRRRRLVVLLVAVAIVAGAVWVLVAQPWQGFALTGPTPSASPSESLTTPPSPTEPAPTTASDTLSEETPEVEPTPVLTPTAEPCIAPDLLVEAVTDKTAYAQGENPQLSIRLTNQSAHDCTLNVGTSAQAFTISSGSDVWWRSTDCQTEPSDMLVLLAAGQQVTSATPLPWDRTRSSVDSCQTERPHAAGGGATYHLSVAIGGISSTGTASFQLY